MTALPNIAIGHWHDTEGVTGCTVLLPTHGAMRASAWVGGGAPGTRETDLLAPTATVQEINALLLTGGSAFGLDAASGVVAYLRERNLGYETGVARVPIIPAAVIFDLDIGSPLAHPDAAAGYAACAAARPDEAREGTVGAGYGARVGALLGPAGRCKGGLGLAGETLGDGDGIAMGALAVVNALGDVLAEDGSILAGTRSPEGGFAGAVNLLRGAAPRPLTNTTLVAVATDARLDKTALHRLARLSHDGLARAISPAHTAFDGDIVFALSSGDKEGNPVALGALAVELVAAAIRRAVRAASGAGGVPAIGELAAP